MDVGRVNPCVDVGRVKAVGRVNPCVDVGRAGSTRVSTWVGSRSCA